MSEDEEETSVLRNNKLFIEAMTARITTQMKKVMNDNLDSLRQELQRTSTHKQDLKPKPPDKRLRSTRSSSHKISHTPKSKSVIYPEYQSSNELYKFSGKRDYLEWEENMDEWFHCNHIVREERLAYAVSQLSGEAYKWWVREVDDRWYYKEPTITSWRELKKLLRKKYAPQKLNCAAQANTPVQRIGVQEKKPALVSDQKQYEELDKRVLEALKAVVKSQKKKSSTTRSDGSRTSKERPSCPEKEMVIQKSESDQSLPICKEPIVLEENESQKHLTSLQAKCALSYIQSDLVLDKLTLFEPEQPSSIVSFSQILEGKYPKEAQRSLPLISELEQPTSHVPKHVMMPFPYDHPRKHCKENDLVRTEPNLFVMVSAQDEKRFRLENVKEFCVSKSVFNEMISTFETITLERFFEQKGFMFEEVHEFNSSLRISLCSNQFELFRPKREYALIKTCSERKNMLCESSLFNVLCKPSLKHHVFEFSTSSIMHLFYPMSDQKGTGATEKHKYLGEELMCSIQIKENHFGMWNWKYLRKTTSATQGCFILKSYSDNDYKIISLIFVFVSKLFPFDVGDRVFLELKSTNRELGKVVKDSSMFKDEPPDSHHSQTNNITEKTKKGSSFQKPKLLFGYKETLMSLTNPKQVIPSKIMCLLQEFEENNPGGLPPFFGLEHQLIDESGTPSKFSLYIIQSKQGKERYESLAIPDVRLLDFDRAKESHASNDGLREFLFDKIKSFELNCFLNEPVFVYNDLSMIAYCISYVKSKEAFSVSNPFTKGFDILVYNQIFDEHVENYTFCTYDPVFGVFVVKEQVMQSEGVKAHAPETWLFNLWLLRFTVQVDYDPWKHLRNKQEEWQGNKRPCRMVFEPGGCLWIQPMSRIDGPFNTTKLISHNACPHHLQGKCNMKSDFKVSNLVLFVADDLDLRSNPFQVGEDDAIMESTKDQKRVEELVAEDKQLGTEDKQLGAEEFGVKELGAEEEFIDKELGAEGAEFEFEPEEHNEPENELIPEKEYGKDVILTSLVLIHDLQMGMCLICTLFPLSSFIPMGFLDKGFNEANDSHSNHPFDDQDWTRTFKKPSKGLAIKSSPF